MSIKVSTCRSPKCSAKIVFLKTARSTIPVDYETVNEGDVNFEHGRHRPHHATCKDIQQFRKPK